MMSCRTSFTLKISWNWVGGPKSLQTQQWTKTLLLLNPKTRTKTPRPPAHSSAEDRHVRNDRTSTSYVEDSVNSSPNHGPLHCFCQCSLPFLETSDTTWKSDSVAILWFPLIILWRLLRPSHQEAFWRLNLTELGLIRNRDQAVWANQTLPVIFILSCTLSDAVLTIHRVSSVQHL